MQVPFLSLKDITEKYNDELHEAVLRVTDSGWYLQGNENKKFEDDYARYIGTKYCVGVANGLQALELMIRACKILYAVSRRLRDTRTALLSRRYRRISPAIIGTP